MSVAKHCARCGASFGCGRDDADCWCTRLPSLPAQALDGVRDCYCPACLAALVAAQTAPPATERDPPADA